VAGCGNNNNDTGAPSSTKAITAYSINGATGIIDETATPKTIGVILPYGTSKMSLIATFTSTGTIVNIGSVTQTSPAAPHDFTNPVVYTVTAADGSSVNYIVTVTVASSSAKSITAYSIAGQVSSTITGTAIAVTMPFGTNKVGLVATFSTSGFSVKVGSALQTSGTTSNNFTTPVTYIVTAADTTTQTYTVTVTVALNSAKAITAYSIASQVSSTIIASSITVTMPFSTPSVTNLVATFSTSGSSVTVGSSPVVTQVSGSTPNNFTNPVVYTVHAANGSTATYTVTVKVTPAAGPAICTGSVTDCVDLGNAANFVILAGTGITDVPASPITGNIGTSGITGASITVPCTDVLTGLVFTDDANYPGFTCTSADKTLAGLAVIDMGTAYTAAAGKAAVPGSCPGVGAFSDAVIGSPLASGVYTCALDVTIPGDLTLNGTSTDVWVFQITGKLTQASATTVHLTGGALAQNVFWQVSDVVEIGTTAHIEGVILAQTAIHMLTGSSTNGRLMAQAAVTLDTATVTEP
jgi:hypothetical protein